MTRPAVSERDVALPAHCGGRRTTQPGSPDATTIQTTLDGAILRVNPDTGAGLPDNPLASSMQTPMRGGSSRMAAKSLPNDLPAGDCRSSSSAMSDGTRGRRSTALSIPRGTVENFGWPCYEGDRSGSARQPGLRQRKNLDICESLYAQPSAVVAPFASYKHGENVVPNDACPFGPGASVAGLAFQFYTGGPYPPEYDGALFFADYARNCIWVMERSGSELPSPSNVKAFVGGAASPVQLTMGPGGEVYYADFAGGTIKRIRYIVPPPPAEDKALNAPATASSSYSADFAPAYGNDGNSGTRWSSAFTDNQWWQVDLGSVRQVDQVRINWEAAYASSYRLSTSTDGTNFTTAADVAISQAGVQATPFTLRGARYVRITGTTRAIAAGISFWDFNVYGPADTTTGDKALNALATASSSYSADFAPAYGNDGNSGTRWSSAFTDNQWWQVDLGSVRQVDQVRINWEAAYASSYRLSTSTDGTNFTTAADVAISQAGVQATPFTLRGARYVRITGTTRAIAAGISFWDFNVYGPLTRRMTRQTRSPRLIPAAALRPSLSRLTERVQAIPMETRSATPGISMATGSSMTPPRASRRGRTLPRARTRRR